jgi:hypothetical protein
MNMRDSAMKFKMLVTVGSLILAALLSPPSISETIPAAPVFTLNDWCDPISPKHNEGPAARYFTEAYVADDIKNERFDALAKKVNDWKKPGCVWADGRQRMSAFYWGLSQAFDRKTDWNIHSDRVRRLRTAYPKSDFAAVVEAEYLMQYAWSARGNGYASSVTSDGWKLFRERMETAEKVLLDSKPYSNDFPIWYVEMVKVQGYLGRDGKEISSTFMEGAKKFPNFLSLYSAMSEFTLPKWGGSWDAYDAFTNWAVENTKATEGSSLYAHLYMWTLDEIYPGENIFKVTKASWPKMRGAFDDLVKRHPNSVWSLNNYAAFSCRAGDKKTYLTIRKKVGKDTIEQAWKGQYTLDLCDSKFGYK